MYVSGELRTYTESRFFLKVTGATPNNLDTCKVKASDLLMAHSARDRFIGMMILLFCGCLSVEDETEKVKLGSMRLTKSSVNYISLMWSVA